MTLMGLARQVDGGFIIRFMKVSVSFICAFLLIGASSTLSAAQEGQSVRDAPWRFNAKIYGWLPKAPAAIFIDQDEVSNIPESLDNILDDLKMTAMFELEAHKGPLGFFVSPVYYKGEDNEKFTGLLDERRKVTLKESCGPLITASATRSGRGHWGRIPIPLP